MAGKILIVDDEKDMLLLLQRIISGDTRHELVTEANPLKAVELFKKQSFDLVITDLKMPKMDGLKLLEEVKKIRPKVSVIVMTAYGTIEAAVEAIQKGAYDFITKPFQRQRILLTIDKVMKWHEIIGENLALRQALAEKGVLSSMIGSTPVMVEIFERIRQVAPTMATVLITGASGTGKELIAKAIHHNSLRQKKKIITVNCTAIPENVIESELFGHVKGAFTGAWKDKKGLVEEAHEGTLFLDEIGDLSPGLQTKLLRLLQEGEYRPVGNEITRKADLRFIAATNHDLKTEIKENRFREDLFYRLNVIHFYLPPLRERKQDIPVLSTHFLKKYTRLYQKDVLDISPAAMQTLMLYDFPGNIRELENIIERAVIMSRTNSLTIYDLAVDNEQAAFLKNADQDGYDLNFKEAKDKMIALFHRNYIIALLNQTNGNISRAAQTAGIQRQYLHRLMKESGIDADDFRSKESA
ncbi:MAG: sigma-54 dependent transcriptional regulator [Desulfobacteraceae bacterium]|jgi:DNA-binding NtrC family response regulator|nr:sigma-54 dependent transcriptional regulator [Desulfobacteraceae bacterium]